MRFIQNLSERSVILFLIALFFITSIASAFLNPDFADREWWSGFLQNFSTEVLGAIATFILFEMIIGVKNEKERLLLELRSSDNATALNALERIKEKGWDKDGSLNGVNLRNANLQRANLKGADLQGAILEIADLQGAVLENCILTGSTLRHAKLKGAFLSGTQLQSSNLVYADLQNVCLDFADLYEADCRDSNMEGVGFFETNLKNVHLENVKFDITTSLPDSTKVVHGVGFSRYDKYWTPETDMSRYTDPNHPDFWQPDWVKNNSKP